jgi:hypothetical protein
LKNRAVSALRLAQLLKPKMKDGPNLAVVGSAGFALEGLKLCRKFRPAAVITNLKTKSAPGDAFHRTRWLLVLVVVD